MTNACQVFEPASLVRICLGGGWNVAYPGLQAEASLDLCITMQVLVDVTADLYKQSVQECLQFNLDFHTSR